MFVLKRDVEIEFYPGASVTIRQLTAGELIEYQACEKMDKNRAIELLFMYGIVTFKGLVFRDKDEKTGEIVEEELKIQDGDNPGILLYRHLPPYVVKTLKYDILGEACMDEEAKKKFDSHFLSRMSKAAENAILATESAPKGEGTNKPESS